MPLYIAPFPCSRLLVLIAIMIRYVKKHGRCKYFIHCRSYALMHQRQVEKTSETILDFHSLISKDTHHIAMPNLSGRNILIHNGFCKYSSLAD